MKKPLFIFFGFFVLISVIWLLSNWQLQKWEKNLLQDALPKLKAVGSEELPKPYSSLNSDYKEFVSSDGKLRMKYPVSWLTIENEGVFAITVPEKWGEKYNLKTVFLAQYFKADKFAQLMVQKGIFDIPTEEIIEKMQSNNLEQGLEMEIVQLSTENNKTIFEAKYLMANSPNLYSKEKILSLGGETYLIAFITLEKNWQGFSEEADFLLDSSQVVQ